METPKKILYISGNGNPKELLIFREMELLTQARKIKKISSKESSYTFLYFGKWNFLVLIFSQKLFLYFGKRKPRKSYLYFRKWNFSLFQEVNFRARKIKINTLKKLLAPSLKNLLYFRRKLAKPQAKKISYFLRNSKHKFIHSSS